MKGRLARRVGRLVLAAFVGSGAGLFASAPPAAAQDRASVRGGVVLEDYAFDPGLGFDALRQRTFPVVVGVPLTDRVRLTVAGGWADVAMDMADGTTREVSGSLDTEARLEVGLLPDRLRLFLSGAAPTGIGAVAEEDVVLLGPLSNDLLGFATPTLGGGGSVGVGLAGAAPAGRASVGYAVHLRVPLSYEPVLGTGDEVRAGNEVRLRLGLESPVARRAFFRAAAVVSVRSHDELNSARVNGVGNRFAGYAAFDAPVGPMVASLWASGLYRSDPSFEPTAVGAAFVPRGGLLAAGARLVIGLGAVTRLEPEVEYRTASAASDAAGLDLENLGDVLRFGARLRRPLVGGTRIVAEGGGLVGTVHDGLVSVDVSGFRAALFLEWSR